MAYVKQNFTDGQVLKAEHLNHIEDGIANETTPNALKIVVGSTTYTFDGSEAVSITIPTYEDASEVEY